MINLMVDLLMGGLVASVCLINGFGFLYTVLIVVVVMLYGYWSWYRGFHATWWSR